MDENNCNNIDTNSSWNPLNYTQNLCVVNARNQVTNHSFGVNHEIVHQLSALHIQTNAYHFNGNNDNIDANNGMKPLIDHMIGSNERETTLDSNQSFASSQSKVNNILIGDNPQIKTNRPGSICSNNVSNSLLNCGDIAVANDNKFDYQLNSLNDMTSNRSAYNVNSMSLTATKQTMQSDSLADFNSYPQQIRPINTTPAQQLSHQITHQSSQQNINQSSVRPKSQSMPYNHNQNYHQFVPTIDNQSLQENSHQTSRHLRSIRARNSTSSTIEPINKLNYYLDRCYDQFKHLEKERKKIELELSHAFSGQKISSANNIPIQRLPQNATKMDRLLTDMSREHAKVITIIAKMEQLRGNSELADSIHSTIHGWLQIIRKLQMIRKDQILTNNSHISNAGYVAEVFLGQILDTVKELSVSARSVRTSLWCAYVSTIFDKPLS